MDVGKLVPDAFCLPLGVEADEDRKESLGPIRGDFLVIGVLGRLLRNVLLLRNLVNDLNEGYPRNPFCSLSSTLNLARRENNGKKIRKERVGAHKSAPRKCYQALASFSGQLFIRAWRIISSRDIRIVPFVDSLNVMCASCKCSEVRGIN